MYIIIGQDREQRAFAKKEASSEGRNEAVRPFDSQCFKVSASDNNFEKNNFQRITFRSHGNPERFGTRDFGNYTPESFVQTLKDFGLPHSVTEIDLIGCTIGLRVDPNSKSFVQEVADLLAHEVDPKFEYLKNIKVRAFANENLDNKYIKLLVHRTKNIDNQYARIYTKEEYKQYKEFISKIKELKSERIELQKKIKRLSNNIEDLEDDIKSLNERLKKRKSDRNFSSKQKDIEKEIRNKTEELSIKSAERDTLWRQEVEIVIKKNQPALAKKSTGTFISDDKAFDSRKILDSNPNFLIKPMSNEKYQLLTQLIETRQRINATTQAIKTMESNISKIETDLPQIEAQLAKSKAIVDEKQAVLDVTKKKIDDEKNFWDTFHFTKKGTKSSSSTSSSSSLSTSSSLKNADETKTSAKRLKTSASLGYKSNRDVAPDTSLKNAEKAVKEAQNQFTLTQATLSTMHQELTQTQAALATKKSELQKLQVDYDSLKEQITRLNTTLVQPTLVDPPTTSSSSSSSSYSSTYTDSYDSDDEKLSSSLRSKWTPQEVNPKWQKLNPEDKVSNPSAQKNISTKEEKSIAINKEADMPVSSSYRPR